MKERMLFDFIENTPLIKAQNIITKKGKTANKTEANPDAIYCSAQ